MKRFWEGPVYCGPGPTPCEVRSDAELSATVFSGKPGYRLLFVGTSQTVGAGARRLDETFFSRVHRTLSAALEPMPLESLNVSVSASNSARLLKDYGDRYLQFRPDVVVINLGNNDSITDFGKHISGFLELNALHGIKTVLLEEANSGEVRTSASLADKHDIMRRLAEQYNVPIYRLDDFLRQPEVMESGFMWWDVVHLTSHGHAVVARWLAPKLLTLFGNAGALSAEVADLGDSDEKTEWRTWTRTTDLLLRFPPI